MTESTVQRTVQAKRVGNTNVVQETVSESQQVEPDEFALAKMNQVLWFIGHLIALLLVIRFFFLLLGANLTGIVLFIYNVTNVFVLPFRNVFPSAQSGVSFFDTAAVLAIVMYYVIIFILDRVIVLFSKNTEA